jgi:hypothetical protein
VGATSIIITAGGGGGDDLRDEGGTVIYATYLMSSAITKRKKQIAGQIKSSIKFHQVQTKEYTRKNHKQKEEIKS